MHLRICSLLAHLLLRIFSLLAHLLLRIFLRTRASPCAPDCTCVNITLHNRVIMATRYLGRRPFYDYFNDLANDTYFEINGQMIGLLPKFNGVNGDNPLTHLRDLHLVCNTLRNRYVAEEDFMLRMLPYSLVSDAKSWMFSLYVDTRLTWDQMRQLFLKEYSIKQHSNESTYEYFERFRDSIDTCLDFSFPEHVLIISFLDGMSLYEREMMDLMARGSILDCYPEDVWELIHKRAEQTKPIEFSNSAYIEQEEEWKPSEQFQKTMDMIAKWKEEDEERRLLLEKDATEPVAQSLAHLVVKPNVEQILEAECVTEGCKDEESTSTQFEEQTEVQVQTQVLAQPEAQTEAQVSAQPELCRETEPDPNTTMEQGIIVYTPNIVLIPNFILSSHFQEDKPKTPSEEKIGDLLDKITTQGPLVHICKQRSIHKRSLDEVCVNQKMCKKAKRMEEEVSMFFPKHRMRHSYYAWKPGWDLCSSATNYKATKNIGQCWKKFDGVHPWAPNI